MQTKTEVLQNHDNKNIRSFGQEESQHKEYKRLKLRGCHAYDHSSDQTAVVA
jgi:hypothetical protein